MDPAYADELLSEVVERVGLHGVVRPLAFLFAADEAGVRQEFHVMGYRGLRHPDRLGEIADAGPSSGVFGDELQQPQASGVGECFQSVGKVSADKPKVLAEMFRVLVAGGRIGISDVVAEDDVAPKERADRGSYVGCIAGALSQIEYTRFVVVCTGCGFRMSAWGS